jgi:thiosulfate/3-mercaptopyruvate sulfurtransferase
MPVRTHVLAVPNDKPSLLLTTEWLSDHLEDPSLIILHIGNKETYEDKHIPGSQLLSLRNIIEDKRDGLSHEMPSIDKLHDTFSSLGINDDSRIIICYDSEQAIPWATRVFVTLEYLGFSNNTFLLNGGLNKWLDEKRVVTDKIPESNKGTITRQPEEDIIVKADWVNKKLKDPSVIIIDARPEGQYNGREEDHNAKRDGHIAGAVNIPFYNLSEEKNAHIFKDLNELKKIYNDAGATKGSEIVTYCGSGIWAAPVYFAARALGYKTYYFDGSYQEWSADENLPVIGPVKPNAF